MLLIKCISLRSPSGTCSFLCLDFIISSVILQGVSPSFLIPRNATCNVAHWEKMPALPPLLRGSNASYLIKILTLSTCSVMPYFIRAATPLTWLKFLHLSLTFQPPLLSTPLARPLFHSSSILFLFSRLTLSPLFYPLFLFSLPFSHFTLLRRRRSIRRRSVHRRISRRRFNPTYW